MLRDLTPALDLLDLAIASSDGLASEADRKTAAVLADAARRRQNYFSGAVIVAIAGGTGSGKSSLLNALAGREVASVSVLRPHTDEPLAWIPAGDAAIAAAVEAMIDMGLPFDADEANRRVYAIYDREGIEYQRVFDQLLRDVYGRVPAPILAAGIIAYRRRYARP